MYLLVNAPRRSPSHRSLTEKTEAIESIVLVPYVHKNVATFENGCVHLFV